MKIIIAGSRDFKDPGLMIDTLNDYHDQGRITTPIEIVCGEARGADTIGRNIAKWQNWPIHSFPAQWDKYGKSAGYRRNAEMAEFADVLIAFWDGESKGTKHMIDIMESLGKPTYVRMY